MWILNRNTTWPLLLVIQPFSRWYTHTHLIKRTTKSNRIGWHFLLSTPTKLLQPLRVAITWLTKVGNIFVWRSYVGNIPAFRVVFHDIWHIRTECNTLVQWHTIACWCQNNRFYGDLQQTEMPTMKGDLLERTLLTCQWSLSETVDMLNDSWLIIEIISTSLSSCVNAKCIPRSPQSCLTRRGGGGGTPVLSWLGRYPRTGVPPTWDWSTSTSDWGIPLEKTWD